MTNQEWIEFMEGIEILSIKFEGCVLISDGKIWQNGEIIDQAPSNKTFTDLFNELAEAEGI